MQPTAMLTYAYFALLCLRAGELKMFLLQHLKAKLYGRVVIWPTYNRKVCV